MIIGRHSFLIPFQLILLFATQTPGIGEASEIDLTFSGYGTASTTRIDDKDSYYRTDLQHPSGADQSWTGSIDSRLWGQFDLNFGENWRATLQLVTDYLAEGHYSIDTEWAYISWQIDENLNVRTGRLRIPTSLASDYLNVGLAFLPLRLPPDIYGQMPLSHFDGADLIINSDVGSYNITIQPFAGIGTTKLYSNLLGGIYSIKAKMIGINVSFILDTVRFNFDHTETKLYPNIPAVNSLQSSLDAAASLYPIASSVSYDLGKDIRASWTSLGAQYEDYRLNLMAEYAVRNGDSEFMGNDKSWYILGGYRFGVWTPYLLYSEFKKTSANSDNRLPDTGPLAPLNTAVNQLLQANMENSYTKGIGVRFDMAANWALKFQYEHISGGGLFLSHKNDITRPQNTGVYSAALNFVF